MLDHLNIEAPHIMTMICGIKNFEGSDYLLKCVSSLFKQILELNEHVKILAKQRHVTRIPFSGEEPLTEFYPAFPLQYKKNNFKWDNTEENTDGDCNKEAPKAPKMTPGLAHIFCRHGICKGFTCMTTAESPRFFYQNTYLEIHAKCTV